LTLNFNSTGGSDNERGRQRIFAGDHRDAAATVAKRDLALEAAVDKLDNSNTIRDGTPGPWVSR
jgi:hypothetical protein